MQTWSDGWHPWRQSTRPRQSKLSEQIWAWAQHPCSRHAWQVALGVVSSPQGEPCAASLPASAAVPPPPLAPLVAQSCPTQSLTSGGRLAGDEQAPSKLS